MTAKRAGPWAAAVLGGLGLAGATYLSSGPAPKAAPVERPLRIEDVRRVFVITPREFLVYARRGDRLVPIEVYRSSGEIEVAPDVPEGKPMWVDGSACASAFCNAGWFSWAVVHVHDAAELGGGESGGKTPRRLRALE